MPTQLPPTIAFPIDPNTGVPYKIDQVDPTTELPGQAGYGPFPFLNSALACVLVDPAGNIYRP